MNQNKEEILTRLKSVFQDTFTDNSYVFSIDMNREDIEGWDSLSHIRLLTAIEADFDLQFDLEEIENLSNVAAIVGILHNKLHK